jgi:hypothetical protein
MKAICGNSVDLVDGKVQPLQLLPPVLSGLINSDIGFKIELHRI